MSHFFRAKASGGLQLLPVLLVALQRGRVALCAFLQVVDERPREGDEEEGREGANGSLSLVNEMASERSGVRRMRE